MKTDWRSESLHWLLLAAMFAGGALSWNAVPERIPVHYGLTGEPDRWGGRFEGLFALPLVAVAVYLAFLLLRRIDPLRKNYSEFAGAWQTIRLAILVMLAAIEAMVLLMVRGWPVRPMVVMPMVLGLFLIAVGNSLGELRPNWFMGVRTPWTLSSRRSWDASHRFGRRALITAGAVMVVAGIVGRPWAFMAALAFLVLAAIATVVVSYREWRDDPDRAPVGLLRR